MSDPIELADLEDETDNSNKENLKHKKDKDEVTSEDRVRLSLIYHNIRLAGRSNYFEWMNPFIEIPTPPPEVLS